MFQNKISFDYWLIRKVSSSFLLPKCRNQLITQWRILQADQSESVASLYPIRIMMLMPDLLKLQCSSRNVEVHSPYPCFSGLGIENDFITISIVCSKVIVVVAMQKQPFEIVNITELLFSQIQTISEVTHSRTKAILIYFLIISQVYRAQTALYTWQC